MGKFKSILDKLGFEEYMAPYVIMFGVLYIIGAVKFLGMLDSSNGILIYIAYIFGGALGIFFFLKIFQAISRLVGVNKIYDSIKKKK